MFCNEFWTLTSLQRAVDRKQKFLSLQVQFVRELGIWFYNLGYCVCLKKTVTEAATECATCLATGVAMHSCSIYWCHSKADLLSCPHKVSKLKVQTFKSVTLKCENTFNAHPRSNTLVSAWTLGTATTTANPKASSMNSNFRCSATLLSVSFPGYSSSTSTARPLLSS